MKADLYEPQTVGDFVQYVKRFPGRYNEFPEKFRRGFEESYAKYEKWCREDPIYYLKPNLAQFRLFTQFNKDGHMPRSLMLEGSNKVGKSYIGVSWQIAMAVGFYPWLDPERNTEYWHFDFDPNWKIYREILKYCGFSSYDEVSDRFFQIAGKLIPNLKVPNVNLAIGETFVESVDKDLVPKYLELIPKDWKPVSKKSQQGIINKITLTAGPGKGSIFYFRSFKSTADEFEGIDTSGSILWNEPPPEDIVIAVSRGSMPFDTRALFAYTSLKEAWIYRDYVNKASKWLI